MPRRRTLLPVLILLIAAGILWWVLRGGFTSDIERLRIARHALRSDKLQLALDEADNVRDPKLLHEALLVAGEAASRMQQFEIARERYLRAESCATTDTDRAAARLYGGEMALALRWLKDAEDQYRAALLIDPGKELIQDRLVMLLLLEGRVIEARALLRKKIENNSATVNDLLTFGHPERLRQFGDALQNVPDRAEAGNRHLIGLARDALAAKDSLKALDLARQVVETAPDLPDAQLVIGTALRDQSASQFLLWWNSLHPELQQQPALQTIAGLALEPTQPEIAARLFADVLDDEPGFQTATTHLSALLSQLANDPAADRLRARPERNEQIEEELAKLELYATTLRERAERNVRIEAALDALQKDENTKLNLKVILPLLVGNGRYAEARCWKRLGLQRFGHDLSGEIVSLEIPNSTDDRADIATMLDNAGRRNWKTLASNTARVEPGDNAPRETEAAAIPIRLEGKSSEIGFDFSFINAPSTSATRMIESNGGGVGVLDADLDAWPDVWMTQGGEWPTGAAHISDQLIRNLQGQRLANVSAVAGIAEPGFSQGVAIGDINADGFPDVFVACAGQSRLFQNLGDGTFEDITNKSGLSGEHWSTSALICDLNADGLDDLFVVNYLSLADASAELCHDGNRLRRCDRMEFSADDDQLWINDGAGSFVDVSATAGIGQPNGRGMGAVTADFNDDHLIDLFVANDAVPNYLFLQQAADPATTNSAPVFSESAAIAGVATDGQGVPQACMGVALSDFDGNLKPDIFVTNFYHEANTMYLSSGFGLFNDRSAAMSLAQPSIGILGFGTQGLDADLDGDDDLVVLNGHLDDLSAAGIAYRMPTQVFANRAGRDFQLQPATTNYLKSNHLGRALATLDWNRDSRPDLIAGLLDEPSCMLENQTDSNGRSLQLRLIGTSASRFAAGSTVTVSAGDQRWRRYCGTGGYQASNEHVLTIGLGKHNGPVQITVNWTDGSIDEFVPRDTRELISLVQGRSSRCYLVPR